MVQALREQIEAHVKLLEQHGVCGMTMEFGSGPRCLTGVLCRDP